MAPTPITAATLTFYLDGRDDAVEDFVAEDFDQAALAAQVLGGPSIHDVCSSAIAADLATDLHDGTKKSWIDARTDEIAEAGIDAETAYAAWRQGYLDKAAGLLDDYVEAALVELADETTAVETPAGKRGAARPKGVHNPLDRGPTYAAFERDGESDATSAYTPETFEEWLDSTLEPDLAARVAVECFFRDHAKLMRAGFDREAAATAREDGLDPTKAFEFWCAGWKRQTAALLRRHLQRDR